MQTVIAIIILTTTVSLIIYRVRQNIIKGTGCNCSHNCVSCSCVSKQGETK